VNPILSHGLAALGGFVVGAGVGWVAKDMDTEAQAKAGTAPKTTTAK
jgi:hypothetical protein